MSIFFFFFFFVFFFFVFVFVFFFFCFYKSQYLFFPDVTKLLENTEVEAAKIYKLRFLSHMKAIKTNTDARRLLNIHLYKNNNACALKGPM